MSQATVLIPEKVELYEEIHRMHNAGYSLRKIKKELNCSRNTIRKYIHGDIVSICSPTLMSGVNKYHNHIVRELSAGKCRRGIFYALFSQGDFMLKERKTVINMKGITKKFNIGKPNELEILHGIDLKVYDGEYIAIIGESGSGKSTLMNIIGALDRPTEGEYIFNNEDLSKMSDRNLSEIRNKTIGFVFQNFNLISRASALKNVEMPMMYGHVPTKERTRKAKKLLDMVEMHERYDHKPNELSGGQKQRVAIARAMANDPSIILADEPTGALDSKTGRTIMNLFHTLHKQGKTIILITHSQELACETERIVKISDGLIVSDIRQNKTENTE